MELFNYLLKASACSVLFFAFYLLVLRRLTFFKLNRFYLLATLTLSFLIPALNVTIEKQVEQTLPIAEELVAVDLPSQLETVIPTEVVPLQTSQATSSFDWFSLLPYSYAAVALTLIGIGLWQLSSLLWHARRNQKTDIGLRLVTKKSGFTNCSFFNYVFVDQENLTEQELAVLLRHEQVHAEQYHSVDKMVMMVAKAVMWFNPIIYLWDKALEQVHEYEADEVTANSFNTRDYAKLLLSLVVSQHNTPLIHNFVKSPIKERIKMLFNSKSKNMKKLMYLLVTPIVLGLIWGFTVKIVEVNTRDKKENVFTDEHRSDLRSESTNAEDQLFGKRLRAKVKSVEKTEVGEIVRFEYEKRIIPVFNASNLASFKIGEEMLITVLGKLNELTVMDSKGKILKDLYTPCYTLSKLETVKEEVLYKAQHSFIEIDNITFAGGAPGRVMYVKSPKGKQMKAVLITENFGVKFLVNGKLYSYEEAKKFDQVFLNRLSNIQGVGRGNYYDVKGVGVNDYVFWFGKEPAILSSVGKSRVAAAKYIGKSVFGKVLNYTYSKDDNKVDGFVIQQKENEKLWIYIGKQFGREVSNDIKLADEVKINVFNAHFSKGAVFPTIGSSTVVKNGKVIFDRAKLVVDARPEGVKTDYGTLAKIEYVASDSTIFSEGRKVIELYGNVKLNVDSISINAERVTINNNNRVINAYNATVTSVYNNVKTVGAVKHYMVKY